VYELLSGKTPGTKGVTNAGDLIYFDMRNLD
jgi:hypothetical protein